MAGFLDLLELRDRDEVLRGSRRFHYPAGATYHQDRAAPMAVVVERGLIRIFVSSDEGRQASVAYFHPGDTYAALEMIPAAAAALQALTDSTVLVLDPDNLTRLMTQNHSVGAAAIRVMGRELARLVRVITVRSLGSMTERLAFDLLERASKTQLREGELLCHVTHEQLADSIGSTREVVSRLVGDLRRRGLLVTSPGQIRVVDVSQLSWIVHGLLGTEGPPD
jgi:CRP/FNR family transcriptional regulator, cyclic AMP receptor protein